MLAAKTYLHIVNVVVLFILHTFYATYAYIDSSVEGRGTRIISCINENATGSKLH